MLKFGANFPRFFLFRWCTTVALISLIFLATFFQWTVVEKCPGQVAKDYFFDDTESDKKSDNVRKMIRSYSELNCPRWDNDKISVHLILHSHQDPGWLRTPDQYYQEQVSPSLSSVIPRLIMDPQRKFTYSEMYFFNKWWANLNRTMQRAVAKLVHNGQLEFVGGGWVQNDEATTHYTAAINQMTYGWSKIFDHFGERALPKTAWQIDSFGYSQEQADIFQQMGFNAEVISRLHHRKIVRRRRWKEMEFLWTTSPEANLFTHALYDHYMAPEGFRFEQPDLNQNGEEKIKQFFKIVKARHKAYRTNHLFLIMGDNFHFMDADKWFLPIDSLIRNGNVKQLHGNDIQLFYSTPSCYFKAVQETSMRRNVTWSTYTGDFFPYATSSKDYCTGYFSSRTMLKRLITVANNMLLTVQSIATPVSNHLIEQCLNTSREALYTAFHHNAITGTCKQTVAEAYARLALESMTLSQKIINLALPMITGQKLETTLEFCPLLNISICEPTQKYDYVTIIILNGFSRQRTSYVRLPVDSPQGNQILANDGQILPYQITPVTDEARQFEPIAANRSVAEIGFFAELPAFGFATFYLQKKRSNVQPGNLISQADNLISNSPLTDKTISLQNEFLKLSFDSNGKLASITHKDGGVAQKLVQTFSWYSCVESGAYVFRPTSLNSAENNTKIEWVQKGPLVEEARQIFSPWVTQTIRVFKNKPYIEFEWTVGPLEPKNVPKEVITRFETDLKSKRIFYTDANGRRLMKRKRNGEDSDNPIAASYFPVTTAAAIKDDSQQLSLLVDRPMGASSAEDGSLELLLYRKLLNDDGAGMGEGLNEEEYSRGVINRGKIWLILSPVKQEDQLWRRLAKEMFYEPILAFSQSKLPTNWPNKFSLIQRSLPEPVHILTLQKSNEHQCLIRFEHFQSNYSSRPVSLGKFEKCFHNLAVSECSKTQLGGWNRNKDFSYDDRILQPMEIATYKCSCK